MCILPADICLGDGKAKHLACTWLHFLAFYGAPEEAVRMTSTGSDLRHCMSSLPDGDSREVVWP